MSTLLCFVPPSSSKFFLRGGLTTVYVCIQHVGSLHVFQMPVMTKPACYLILDAEVEVALLALPQLDADKHHIQDLGVLLNEIESFLKQLSSYELLLRVNAVTPLLRKKHFAPRPLLIHDGGVLENCHFLIALLDERIMIVVENNLPQSSV